MPPIAEPSRPPREERAPKPAPAPKPERAPKPAPVPKPERTPKPERAHRPQREPGWYVSARYQPPVSEWQVIDAEGGRRFGNGMYLGAGVDYNMPENGLTSTGISLNYGLTYDLPVQMPLTLAYGVFGGCRFIDEGFRMYAVGPSVRLRWRFVDVSYRGIIGNVVSPSFMATDEAGNETGRKISNSDFVYINQLMVGVYFAF